MVGRMLRDMTMGVDIVEASKAQRNKLTVHDAFDVWVAKAKEKNRRWGTGSKPIRALHQAAFWEHEGI